ncbi:MAG: hypothetical protein QXS69_03570 [Candidatus Aenigmatarchaeota archaeon]
MIEKIIGLILIFLGVLLIVKNSENVFRDTLKFDVFEIFKKIEFIAMLLILIGIILILW